MAVAAAGPESEVTMGFFGNTFPLMRASWSVLKQDKEMLLFPLFSGAACLAVLATFAFPIMNSDLLASTGEGGAGEVVFYGVLFLYYFANYFVITFFNTAIIACAVKRMRGGDPTFSDGIRAATGRLPIILGWALLSATVGLILRIIEDKSDWLGKLVAGLLGMAWTVTSFLVVPVLVVQNKGPIDALKESTSLLRKTWGEQLIGNFGFGLVGLLMSAPGAILIVIGIALGSTSGYGFVPVTVVGLGVLALLLAALTQSALQSIFQAALYLYASDGEAPSGFDGAAMRHAMRHKG
ncbi:MAG: DUF6159 family protein [Planctomycetota bacterium]